MMTIGLLALSFGPCLAFVAWVLKNAPNKEELRQKAIKGSDYRQRFFTTVGNQKQGRTKRFKQWLAQEQQLQEHARNNPDEFQ